MLDLYEFEASEGAGSGDTGAAAGLTPEAAEPGAGEAADLSAVSAPAAAPVWETPEFREAVAEQAAEIAQAQIAAMRAEQAQAPEVAGQPYVPPALDPYSDTFGQDLASLLEHNRQQTMNEMRTLVQPVTESLTASQMAAQQAEGDQRVADIIADDIARNGDLGTTAQSLIRPLASIRYDELIGRGHPHGPRTGELAVQSAATTVRQSVAEERTAAATAETNRISTLGGVLGQPAAGAAGVSGIQEIELDPRRLVEKHSQRMHALNNGN